MRAWNGLGMASCLLACGPELAPPVDAPEGDEVALVVPGDQEVVDTGAPCEFGVGELDNPDALDFLDVRNGWYAEIQLTLFAPEARIVVGEVVLRPGVFTISVPSSYTWPVALAPSEACASPAWLEWLPDWELLADAGYDGRDVDEAICGRQGEPVTFQLTFTDYETGKLVTTGSVTAPLDARGYCP
jgi:hypothetical protein